MFSTNSFLFFYFFYFIELKSHCPLCRLVVKDDQEEEFQQLGPEVRQSLSDMLYVKIEIKYSLSQHRLLLSGPHTDGTISLSSGKVHSLPLSSVYTWGNGISAPLRLPMLNTEVLQVSLGRTQKMGVTKSGRLITWEVCVQHSLIRMKPASWIFSEKLKTYVNMAG